jgi:hypothetical protein
LVFEKFIPPRKTRAPQVSLKRTGTITFDATAVEAFSLAKISAVSLYFDPSRSLAGVKAAADPREEGALRLTHRKRVSSVRARQFFEVYGIPLTQNRTLPATYDRDDDMIVLDLAEVRRHQDRPKKKE